MTHPLADEGRAYADATASGRVVAPSDLEALIRWLDSSSLPLDMQTWRTDLLRRVNAPRSRTLLDEMADELDRLTGALERIHVLAINSAMSEAEAVRRIEGIAREALAAGRPADRSEP